MINKENFSIDVFHQCRLIDSTSDSPKQQRMDHLQQALACVSVEGTALEFGVFRGKTMRSIANHFQNETVYGFDSFEGLPEDWKKTKGGPIIHSKGHFAVDMLPSVPDNATLIKGWFDETLPTWMTQHQDRVKFLHLDADLYSSTISVLSKLNSRIVSGTVIVFDEMYPWRAPHKYDNWAQGEFKALKEWLEIYDRSFEPLFRNNYNQCSIRIL